MHNLAVYLVSLVSLHENHILNTTFDTVKQMAASFLCPPGTGVICLNFQRPFCLRQFKKVFTLYFTLFLLFA